MNQSIQFPDVEQWNDDLRAVCFPALMGGFQVNCAISAVTLTSRFGGETPAEWLALFRQHRWDLEEEIEPLIAEGQDDDQGLFWLS
jgi:DNA-binding IclR family transcriptional regulator